MTLHVNTWVGYECIYGDMSNIFEQKLYKVEVKSCYGDLTQSSSTAKILVGDNMMIYNLSRYKNGDILQKRVLF